MGGKKRGGKGGGGGAAPPRGDAHQPAAPANVAAPVPETKPTVVAAPSQQALRKPEAAPVKQPEPVLASEQKPQTSAILANEKTAKVVNGLVKKTEELTLQEKVQADKEMTAEEKKAQREKRNAEKAAKKKAAAEKQADKPAEDKAQGQQKKDKPPLDEKTPRDGHNGHENAPAKLKPVLKQGDLTKTRDLSDRPVPREEPRQASPLLDLDIHPAFRTIVARCDAGKIVGADALLLEFIYALKLFLEDTLRSQQSDPTAVVAQVLETAFGKELSALNSTNAPRSSLPFPHALGNFIRLLKGQISKLEKNITPEETLQFLDSWLNDWTEANLELATKSICDFALQKMHTASGVLIYDWSLLVNEVLLAAVKETPGTSHFWILDSLPNGRAMQHAKSLAALDVECTYGDLSALGYAINNVSLVVLGCAAVLSNGEVVASRGSSQVAMVAQFANVPVLVLAPTYKFVDKVHSSGRSALLGDERLETIPAALVTAIVTEIRVLPSSSAPAVLQAKTLVQ